MEKKALIGAVVAGVLVGCVVAMRGRSSSGSTRSEAMRRRRQARIRRRMERMPAEFPPKIVHDLVPAIKADTEKILDLLGEEPNRPDQAD